MRDTYRSPPPRAPRTETGMSRRALLGLRLSPAARRGIDYAGVVERVRAAWEQPGHEPLLRALEPAAETLAELCAPASGARFLDVGAGDGNLALAALRRGATVDACDLSPAMVERGRARCGDAVHWRVGQASALPYVDGEFDVVASSFGAALAPRARRAARELVRVTRPGGTVAVASWVPRGLPGRLDELVEPLDQRPDGVRPPADWGIQQVCERRLAPLLEGLEIRTRVVRLGFPSTDVCFAALARPYLLDGAQREQLRPRFDRLLASCNNTPSGAVEIDARFLIARGVRPGM